MRHTIVEATLSLTLMLLSLTAFVVYLRYKSRR